MNTKLIFIEDQTQLNRLVKWCSDNEQLPPILGEWNRYPVYCDHQVASWTLKEPVDVEVVTLNDFFKALES
jgi:hypothetical protein